jgi:hypothetical protein
VPHYLKYKFKQMKNLNTLIIKSKTMKKLYILTMFVAMFGANTIIAQCPDYFELIIEPTITEEASNGNTLKAELKISLYNPTMTDGLELYTMQNAIGITDALSSFITHTGESAELASGSGAQVATEHVELVSPVNYDGRSYTSWLAYGHTVNGNVGFEPQMINHSDTALIATITLNFDGSQAFTDDPFDPSKPYLADPSLLRIFPGDAVANLPLILNNFGTRYPNGFPRILNCYESLVEGILAVDLFSFNGRVMNEGNKLNWSVMNEAEVDYHVLERKFEDDIDFTEIHKVEGQNVPGELSQYTFMDETISDLSYYRIRSVEKSGEVSLSNVLVLTRELTDIKVFPNPTFGPLSIRYSSKKDESVTFTIIDKLGKVQFMSRKDLAEGHNLVTFDIKDMPAGVYYLEIATADQSIKQKIIKEVF